MSDSMHFFSEIGIELTNRCNLSCLHCLREKSTPRDDFPIGLLAKLLKDAKRYGIKHIAFTGGEPTIHPHFEKIIKMVSDSGFTYHLVTNGWNFKEVFPILEKYDLKILKGLSFSLDSPKESTHDKIRGQGSYRKVLQGVSICYHKKIPFNLQMTVCSLNLKDLEEMAILASKLKAERLYYAFIQPTPENMKAGIVPSPKEQRKIAKEVMRISQTMRIGIFLAPGFDIPELIFQCRALQMSSITVDYKGNIVFCCQLSGYSGSDTEIDIIGNLKDVSLFEAHRKLVDRIAEFQKDRIKKIEKCEISSLDRFPCFYCAKYFGKLDWLKDFPESPWYNG